MNNSIILFDLDGTLADNEHRQHYVTNGLKDWESFFSQQVNDSPKLPIVKLFQALKEADTAPLFVITARPEKYRQITTQWLMKYKIFPARLIMRMDGDRRTDVEVKRDMLFALRNERLIPLFVVDDRTSVVKMWREEGITCLQCEDHDF